jgi:hypothetical protein
LISPVPSVALPGQRGDMQLVEHMDCTSAHGLHMELCNPVVETAEAREEQGCERHTWIC